MQNKTEGPDAPQAKHEVHEDVRNDIVALFADEETLLFYDHFYRNGLERQAKRIAELEGLLKPIAEMYADPTSIMYQRIQEIKEALK